jgi:hypothetical protein
MHVVVCAACAPRVFGRPSWDLACDDRRWSAVCRAQRAWPRAGTGRPRARRTRERPQGPRYYEPLFQLCHFSSSCSHFPAACSLCLSLPRDRTRTGRALGLSSAELVCQLFDGVSRCHSFVSVFHASGSLFGGGGHGFWSP